MTTSTQTYADKSSAARGAKRAGVTEFRTEQADNGRWFYVDEAAEREYAAQLALQAEQDAKALAALEAGKRFADATFGIGMPQGDVVPFKPSGRTYKELEVVAPKKSAVPNVFDVIWGFVMENPEMPRKQVISKLVDMGININTVKTQYQRVKSGAVRNRRGA